MKELIKRVIVALDVERIERALEIVDFLEEIEIFKVGPGLFLSSRGKIIEKLQKKNKKIFLDLKFHDIPNTVFNAVKEATKMGVSMMTVHSLGGKEMLMKASEAAQNQAEISGIPRPLIMAVTILTSMEQKNLKEIGIEKDVGSMVLNLARISKESGSDGVISSPLEIEIIKKNLGDDFLVATPGIRIEKVPQDDQKRVLSPLEAIELGADYIIIGRTIIEKPEKSYKDLLKLFNKTS
ncbi:MAG: orotidine-5'-phosphate decarboxylase [Acidobacteriota bacterium]